MNLKHILIFVILVLTVWWQLHTLQNGNASGPLVGKSMPLFVVQDMSGARFDVRQNLGKKVILLNFWATWCPPCREEMPVLNQLQKELGTEKFVVLGLMEDDASDLAGYRSILGNFKKTIPVEIGVLADQDSAIANKFGTFKLPESYLVDLSGKVIARYEGSLSDWDVKKIRDQVKSLIKSEKQ